MGKSRFREILETRNYEPSHGFTNFLSELAHELRDDLLRKVVEENKNKGGNTNE